jgi:PAS domain S-box-containing protein
LEKTDKSRYFETLIDNSISGAFISSLKGEILYTNTAFNEIFGYDNINEIRELNTSSFYDSIADREDYLNVLKEQGYVKNKVIKGRKKSGEPFLFKINTNLITHHNENLLFGSVIDITNESKIVQKLSEQQSKYDDFINSSVQIIQSFDENGFLDYCNNLWYEKFKYSPDEIKSINLFDLIEDDYKEHCQLVFQDILKGNPAFDVKVAFKSKDGKRMIFQGNVLPITRNGEFISTHAFFYDVTDLELADKKIKHQESVLNTVFNSTPICLYLKDLNGKYIYSNQIMQETLKTSPIGKTDIDLFGQNEIGILKNADREAIENPDRVIRFNFKTDAGENSRHFYCGKKSIVNQDMEPIIFGFTVDITELVEKSKKMEESEKILHSLIDYSFSGFMMFEFNQELNDYTLVYKNEYADYILDIKNDVKDARSILNFLPEAKAEKLYNSSINTLFYEWKKTNSDKIRYYSLNFTKLFSTESPNKLILFIHEFTEKMELINELEQKLSDNKLLIGEVHHRVKNNLAIIDGILELNKYKLDTSGEFILSEIQMRIRSLAIVHEKLYLSESFSTISLFEYVRELSTYFNKTYAFKNKLKADFKLDIDPSILLNLNKSISFGLILSELFSNSFKHSSCEKDVTITIKIEELNGKIYVYYTDCGKGLPKDFELSKSKGFGFKLVLNLVKQLKGEYLIENGNNFKFSFIFNN